LISQFTLFASKKAHRPSFHRAAKPAMAQEYYEKFVKLVKSLHIKEDLVQDGKFGAMMIINAENDGPVTIPIESKDDDETSTAKPKPQNKKNVNKQKQNKPKDNKNDKKEIKETNDSNSKTENTNPTTESNETKEQKN